jgi:regulator of sigma E protease
MLSLIAFLIVFGLVVIAHESGHFFVAKLSGIKVYEFSIGFGPCLFSLRRKGTVYGINALPLGGLVRLAGLDDTAKEKAKKSERYTSKSWAVRAGVLVAGPLMNIVLAFLIFVFIFSVMGVPQKASNLLAGVLPGSSAQAAGWRSGDLVEYFNGQKVTDMEAVIKEIRASRGAELSFVIQRGTERKVYLLRGKYEPEKKVTLIGIQLKPLYYKRYDPLTAVTYGSAQTLYLTGEILFGLGRLLTGRESLGGLAGPLGIAKLSGEAVAQGWLTFLTFIAMLSINLGILNLLPIPALDGGRLFFLLLEKVLPRKISIEKEQIIHYLGFAFLLILVLVITFFDLRRIFNF